MKSTNFVWEATINFKTGDDACSKIQLIAATSFRRALVKAEKLVKEQALDAAELVSIVKKSDVVI